MHSPRRTYPVLGYAAALWLLVSSVASLYYLVCFAAPQFTSQDYKLQRPPIIMGCPTPAGLSRKEESARIDQCLDAARHGSPSDVLQTYDELQKERRRGVRGILLWGSMLIVSAILCGVSWQALRREWKRAAV